MTFAVLLLCSPLLLLPLEFSTRLTADTTTNTSGKTTISGRREAGDLHYGISAQMGGGHLPLVDEKHPRERGRSSRIRSRLRIHGEARDTSTQRAAPCREFPPCR